MTQGTVVQEPSVEINNNPGVGGEIPAKEQLGYHHTVYIRENRSIGRWRFAICFMLQHACTKISMNKHAY